MYSIDDIYKSGNNLKAEDLGTSMPEVTIKTAETRDFGNGDVKVVLTFFETDKEFPLNKTNAHSIADMYTPNFNQWPNMKIMLFSMMVDFQGKMVQAIRIRPPQSGVSAPNGIAATPFNDPARNSAFEQPMQQQVIQNSLQAPISQGHNELNPPPVDPVAYARQSNGQ